MKAEAEYRELDGDIVPYDDAPDDAAIAYATPDATEYMIVAAEAAQALIESPEAAVEAKTSESAERIATVQQRFGFSPLSKVELSDTYDVTGKDLVGGAAQQLNTVFHRQAKYMEDPERTVRSIVGRYASYAENAQREAAFLMMLQEEVQKSEAHPFSRADSIGAVSVWQHEPSVSRPLLAVLQHRDIETFVHDDDALNPLESQASSKERIYSAANKSTIQRLEKMMHGLRVSELAGELESTVSVQKHRFDFWVDILKQSEKHSLARGMVHKALTDLKVTQ